MQENESVFVRGPMGQNLDIVEDGNGNATITWREPDEPIKINTSAEAGEGCVVEIDRDSLVIGVGSAMTFEKIHIANGCNVTKNCPPAELWTFNPDRVTCADCIEVIRNSARETPERDTKAILISAFSKLGLFNAGRFGDSGRWSATDLATDLAPILDEALS